MGVRINIYSVELVRESAKIYELDKVASSPRHAFDIVENALKLSSKTKEHFVMMSLNTKKECIGLHTIHIGSVGYSVVHPRDVLQPAILNNATSFIVFHNHPSGSITPSPEDIKVTKSLVESGRILGIELIDHIIIGTDGRFTSLRDKGYI